MKRKRLTLVLGALGAAVLVGGAVPAFTADSGTINVTVTAQPPATPCVAFATPPGTQVGFGTLAFSTAAQGSFALGDVATRFTNCSTASEQYLISGTDAAGDGATWTLAPTFTSNPCPTQNVYRLGYSTGNLGDETITTFNATLLDTLPGAGDVVLAPGQERELGLTIVMPCEGSNGAGKTLSMNVLLTAQIA